MTHASPLRCKAVRLSDGPQLATKLQTAGARKIGLPIGQLGKARDPKRTQVPVTKNSPLSINRYEPCQAKKLQSVTKSGRGRHRATTRKSATGDSARGVVAATWEQQTLNAFTLSFTAALVRFSTAGAVSGLLSRRAGAT